MKVTWLLLVTLCLLALLSSCEGKRKKKGKKGGKSSAAAKTGRGSGKHGGKDISKLSFPKPKYDPKKEAIARMPASKLKSKGFEFAKLAKIPKSLSKLKTMKVKSAKSPKSKRKDRKKSKPKSVKSRKSKRKYKKKSKPKSVKSRKSKRKYKKKSKPKSVKSRKSKRKYKKKSKRKYSKMSKWASKKKSHKSRGTKRSKKSKGKSSKRSKGKSSKRSKKSRRSGISEWRFLPVGVGKCKPACGDNAFCNKFGRCQCRGGFIGNGFKCVAGCTCTAEGDPHYTLFDGRTSQDMVHFQGPCTYILSELKSASNPECNYKVEVKNDYRNSDFGVTLTRYIKVYVGTDIIYIGQRGDVKINGLKTNCPFTSSNNIYKLQFSEKYYVVITSCNNVIGFDGNNRAFVKANQQYGNDLRGLCGNCNGKKDDCVSPTGVSFPLVKGRCPAADFGNSWVVPNEDEEMCLDADDEPLECSKENKDSAMRLNLCGHLDLTKKKSIFLQYYQQKEEAGMDGLVDEVREMTKAKLDDCLYDVCRSLETGGNGKESACNNVEAYVDDVEDTLAIEMPSWRSKKFCAPNCETNEVYYKNTLSCEATCLGDDDLFCAMQTSSGCGCKEGFKRSGETCVPQNMCGCYHAVDQKYYQIGDRAVTSDCTRFYECQMRDGRGQMMIVEDNRPRCLTGLATCRPNAAGVYQCQCNEGFVGDGVRKCKAGCGPNNDMCHPEATCVTPRVGQPTCKCRDGLDGDGILQCAPMCTCQQSGDPHMTMYDGSRIDFQGPCTYLMSEVIIDATCQIRVEAKHQPDGRRRVSRTLAIYVTVGGDIIKIDQKRTIYRNGARLFSGIEWSEGYPYRVVDTGAFMLVENKCGMSAGFDGRTTVFVTIPASYGPAARGMCGNCDGVQNDIVTAAGVDVSSDPNKDTAIGQSWLVASEDKYANENCDVPADTPFTCADDVETRARDACRIIKNNSTSPFAACLASHRQEARDFFRNCVYDFCVYHNDGIKTEAAVCDAMAQLNDVCVENFAVPLWRTATFCPADKELGCDAAHHLRYEPAMTGCQPTCQFRHLKKRRCRQQPREGCVCDDPTMFYDNGKCVPQEQCGCTVRAKGRTKSAKFEYIPLNTKFVTRNCKAARVCQYYKGRSKMKRYKLPGCNRKSETCGLVDGLYRCVCRNGFELIRGKCVASCKGQQCHANARCTKKGCICKKGFVGDGVNSCEKREKRCTCSAAGDPHYSRFDGGRNIDFMGVCKYTLSQYKTTSNCSYAVNVQNYKKVANAYPSYTKYMDIEFQGYQVRLGQGGAVSIYGLDVATPLNIPGKFFISRAGQWVYMLTECDQRFQFDGRSRAEVDVPAPKSDSDYSGICGNCNGKDDDWVTRDGTTVGMLPKRARDTMYGDGWIVGDDTGLTDKTCRSISDQEPPACGKTEVLVSQNNMCGALTDDGGPFRTCLEDKAMLDTAKRLYTSCAEDVCYTSGKLEDQTDAVCATLALLADACIGEGIPVSFRKPGFCEMECGENMEYSNEIVGCPETCEGVVKCGDPPTEGCVCKSGFVLSNDRCVPKDECGCTHVEVVDGRPFLIYMQMGSFATTPTCSQVACESTEGHPKVVPVVGMETCPSDTSECLLVGGSYMCTCKRGFEGPSGYDCSPVVVVPTSKPGGEVGPPVATMPPASEPLTEQVVTDKPVVTTSREPEIVTDPVIPKTTKPVVTTSREPEIVTDPFIPTTKPVVTTSHKPEIITEPAVAPTEARPPVPTTVLEDEEVPEPCIEDVEPTLPPKPEEGSRPECRARDDTSGLNYWGTQNITANGRTCQRWMDTSPHKHHFRSLLSGESNFCRNRPIHGLTGRRMPWCFTTDPNKVWEYCSVPLCENEAQEQGQEPAPEAPVPLTEEEKGCYNVNNHGNEYMGPVSVTANGVPCDMWLGSGYPFEDNFCRNPITDGSRPSPWCYVDGRKHECDIRGCYEPKPEIGGTPTECIVTTEVSECVSTTTIEGSCTQGFKFPDECEYTVRRLSSESYRVYLTSDLEVVELSDSGKTEHVSKTCGTFSIEDSTMTVQTPTCGMCLQSSVKRMLPSPSNPFVKGKLGFCHA